MTKLRPYILPVCLAIFLMALNFWIPDVDARDWVAILPAAAIAALILLGLHWMGTPFLGLIIVFSPLLHVGADIGQLIVDGGAAE